MTANVQNVYQSRWGFHACDRETFSKLKELAKAFRKAQSQAAAWHRWARKIEKNRSGAEPAIDSVFCTKIAADKMPRYYSARTRKTYCLDNNINHYVFLMTVKMKQEERTWNFKGEEKKYTVTVPDGFSHKETLEVNDFGVIESYNMARRPKEKAEHVAPLPLSKDKIDALYAQMIA